jgi:hypothetical protein
MSLPASDRSTVRALADRVAQIAALPIQKQTAAEWRRLNGLGHGRPLVWINEIPWHEMNVDNELTCTCQDDFCRGVEWQLRTTLYQWEHMRGDMVVEPIFYSPLAIRDSGFGICEESDLIAQDPRGGVQSHGFHPQIKDEKDVERIQFPQLSHDTEATERTYAALCDLLGDILTVRKRGVVHQWFAPWDELIRWWDVQEALTDLALRPGLVHLAMDRLVSAYLHRLQQWRELNLLDLTDGNYRVGSGGLGYTDELPQRGFDPAHVRTMDQWGCATAQIFSDVSPAMHEEFALQYERRWLENFGLNYYGCCEPLHTKLDVLQSVPRLRKISMSPWADVDRAAGKMGDRYVFSHKPSPAVFAGDDWNPALARKNLVRVLERTRSCVVEIIMKDVSTVRNDPRRLWEWAQMAREVAEEYAG